MRSLISFGLLYLMACESDKSVVVRNPAPTAQIISHQDDSEVLEGFNITFEGVVSDSNHTPDQLTVEWRLDGQPVCEDSFPQEDGHVFCDQILDAGDTLVSLLVEDAEGSAGEPDTIEIVVLPSEQPTAMIVSPIVDGKYYSDQLIAFEGVVDDAEDTPSDLVVQWESSLDGVLNTVDSVPNANGEVIGYGLLSEGQHAIELNVTDSTGKSTTESLFIQVGPPNTPPDCSISNPISNTAGPFGGLVVFEGMATDVDIPSSQLSVEWSSDKDGVLGTSPVNSSGLVQLPYSNLSNDTHLISMTVRDEVGAECVATTIFTVGTAPIVSITSPNNGDVINEGESVTFTAEVSDNEDQPNQVSLDWTLDGNAFSTQTATSSGTATFTDATLTYRTYNLQVTATDTAGLFETDQVSFQVNGLPGAPTISLNPTLPTTTDDLTVSVDVDSVDPESHSITYSYAWERDGVLQPSHNGIMVPSSATSKGEIWTVSVTPNDGYGDGTSATADVTVQNTAPTVDALTLSPTPLDATSYYVVCNPTTSDVDGDTVTETFTWFVDGVQQSETSDTFLQSWVVGTEVTCRVTPNDGVTDGTFMETSTIVQNTAPVVDSVTLSPSTVYTNDLITATAVLSDVDVSQSVTATFDWYVEGSLVQSGTDNTLDGTVHFNRDESVYVEVTPNDGVTDGTPLQSSALVVSNTPPVLSSVVVTPDPAVEGTDDLTCDVTGSDVDGDAILYTYEWSNSSAVQQTMVEVSDVSDVFLTGGLTEDTWTCEVTPYDGTDYGTALSDSVTVERGCDPATDYFTLDVGGVESIELVKVCAGDFVMGSPTNEVGRNNDEVQHTVSLTSDFMVGTTEVTQGVFYDMMGYEASIGQSSTNMGEGVNYPAYFVSWDMAADFTNQLTQYHNVLYGTSLVECYTCSGTDENVMCSENMNPYDCSGYRLLTEAEWEYSARANTQFSMWTPTGGADIPVGYDELSGCQSGWTLSDGSLLTDLAWFCGNLSTYNSNYAYGTKEVASKISNDFGLYDMHGNVWEWTHDTYSQYAIGTIVDPVDSSGNTYVFRGGRWADYPRHLRAAIRYHDVSTTRSFNIGFRIAVNLPQDQDEDGIIEWLDCDDTDASVGTGVDGLSANCPGIDCAQILADGHATGDGFYWIDPEQDGGAYEAYCLMDSAYDGGGWTLISTHSDDGQDTWTWNNRHYFDTDTTTFGSLNALNEDFKSPALHDVGMQDLLFIHEPSGVWAGYNDVDSGSGDFGTFVDGVSGPSCYSGLSGFGMTAGTLVSGINLCTTDLYISAMDADGASHCSDITVSNSHSYGPTWSTAQLYDRDENPVYQPCPFNDPGVFGSTGPTSSHGTGWPYHTSDMEMDSIGFGLVKGLNSGTSGQAQNYMQVFVRRDYTDVDGDGVLAWEDCDDNDATVWEDGSGVSAACAAASCKSILDDGHAQLGDDGNYWLDPDGTGAFEAYCDMTTDGGGWTLLGTISGEDGNSWNTQYGLWSDINTVGSPQTPWSDFKSEAWFKLDLSNSNVLWQRKFQGNVQSQVILNNSCLFGATYLSDLFSQWDLSLQCQINDISVITVPNDSSGLADSTYQEQNGIWGLGGTDTNGFCWNIEDTLDFEMKGHLGWGIAGESCSSIFHRAILGVWWYQDTQGNTGAGQDVQGTRWMGVGHRFETVVSIFARDL